MDYKFYVSGVGPGSNDPTGFTCITGALRFARHELKEGRAVQIYPA